MSWRTWVKPGVEVAKGCQLKLTTLGSMDLWNHPIAVAQYLTLNTLVLLPEKKVWSS